jgi:type I restriction enzyme R subunit
VTPEELARIEIDRRLQAAGWVIQDRKDANLQAARGVAVREFPLSTGEADYLLFVDGKALGAVEAKPEGATLKGVETQSGKYSTGLPDSLPAWHRPLPFLYESTGKVTQFSNLREPDFRSRRVFWFHKPETLLELVQRHPLRHGLREMPALITDHLWPAQIKTIRNLEASLARNDPRALIQMATGSGKTFTAANISYRLVKHADARRVLFLVDRKNLGDQTLKEFQGFVTPDDGRKFTELYNVQHLKHGNIDRASRVVICTVQRLYSLLKGEEITEEADEHSLYELAGAFRQPVPVEYTPEIPPETFDVVIVDECHRSIYNIWSQVLEYFDAYLVGLTATPSKQTIAFFNQNMVNSYGHADAVADGVNVGYDVFTIRTQITQSGSSVDVGEYVKSRDLDTGVEQLKQLDDALVYTGSELDRDVVAEDQIRTVLEAFRDALPTRMFPGRTHVPKTLIFAKSDQHAEDIVRICREVFGKGNEFCQKITYRTTGKKPDELIAEFRNSYFPRIAVTVDMIATGTDIKPLEIVMFMRTVKSLNYYEQMKGRGVRIVDATDLKGVTPDADVKDRFVLVDCVGISECDMGDAQPLNRKPSVGFDKLVEAVAFGNREPELVATLASRLARIDRRLDEDERAELTKLAGADLKQITKAMVDALSRDNAVARAKADTGKDKPDDDEIKQARAALIDEAVKPVAANPKFRNTLVDIKRRHEQTIDHVSQDVLLEAGYDQAAKDRARATVTDFEQYLTDHKEELDALQFFFNLPYAQRPDYEALKELANAISRPPRNWTPERLWQAYETLDRSKVKGGGGKLLTDLVSLVRFALHQQDELAPFAMSVDERYEHWLQQQKQAGREFTPKQLEWLGAIKEHIATSLSISRDDFDLEPFVGKGGLGAAWDLFGDKLDEILTELNEALAA